MPTIYRICKTRHAAAAFDGEGARRFGGRWNSRGTRIVYTAGSLALAALEMVVHLGDEQLLLEYSYLTAEVAEDLIISVDDFRQLPANWRDSPAPIEAQQIGDDWAHARASAVLAVPTSIIPLELNYLLNPAHPDFDKVHLGEPTAFVFDERLLKTPAAK